MARNSLSEMSMVKHFPLSACGRDYVVGDVHGCFTRLQAELDKIGFDPAKDRLFSVGDLVDRGPESEQVLEWLDKPWFHAVRGNHEQMAIDHCAGLSDHRIYVGNGGAWILGRHKADAQRFADAFEALPIAIEVETEHGLIGIVHADCPFVSWSEMKAALAGENGDLHAQQCIWSRDRVTGGFDGDVAGVAHVIVGHTPMQTPTSLGNVIYIDTGAVFGRELTIINIH